ncbi:uncharacterized protein TNCV_2620651 [Trichonephila clavipes]|uniref:Uncharacterized protein n=1 Tax=Trichonephila clavipes TaxID=2585209 RepID=A0A8X6WBG1_TRICX|nr:uncharacterized protein TNCV_2620651 [Trichonephila clavipes]
MTLHSPTKNSLAVLNHNILETNSQVQNVKLGGHQTCLSINRLWYELCDMLCRLVGTTASGHHDCSIQEGKRILIGQRKGSLRGRVCGGRVACVVGDGSKERSAESGPRGRGTWLRMARRRGLLHIEKSSLASALDRARQHVMGFPGV